MESVVFNQANITEVQQIFQPFVEHPVQIIRDEREQTAELEYVALIGSGRKLQLNFIDNRSKSFYIIIDCEDVISFNDQEIVLDSKRYNQQFRFLVT